jgi:hypothetical protein
VTSGRQRGQGAGSLHSAIASGRQTGVGVARSRRLAPTWLPRSWYASGGCIAQQQAGVTGDAVTRLSAAVRVGSIPHRCKGGLGHVCRWMPFRRALSKEDQAVFDRMFGCATQQLQAEVQLGRPWTFEAVLMAVLLAHEKQLEQVRMRLEAVSMEEHLPAVAGMGSPSRSPLGNGVTGTSVSVLMRASPAAPAGAPRPATADSGRCRRRSTWS